MQPRALPPKSGEPWDRLQLATFLLTAANMAQRRSQAQRPLLTQEELKKKLEITNFDPNAILRGAQLTVVGGAYLDSSCQVQVLTVSKP